MVEVVQGGDNTGCARLFDLLQRNWVLRPEPPPGFFHSAPANDSLWAQTRLGSQSGNRNPHPDPPAGHVRCTVVDTRP